MSSSLSIIYVHPLNNQEVERRVNHSLLEILNYQNDIDVLLTYSSATQNEDRYPHFRTFDSRIKTRATDEAIAENAFLQQAKGDYLVFVNSWCYLTVDSIQRIQRFTSEYPDFDLLYGDGDVIPPEPGVIVPLHLPEYSPERLLGDFYCRDLIIIKRRTFEQLSGVRERFKGAALYDLVLRCVETSDAIAHIRFPLFQKIWMPENTTNESQIKEFDAVQDALRRRGISAQIKTSGNGVRQIRRSFPAEALVSIIIPTAGKTREIHGQQIPMVESCVSSILNKTAHKSLEIVVVHDNPEATPKLGENPIVKIIPYYKSFNFADKCNIGVLNSTGDYTLILNDDTEIVSDEWIEILCGFLLDTTIAMSGPMLLFENNEIQSAGIFNNPGPQNYCPNQNLLKPQIGRELEVSREVSGLTGACFAIKKSVFTDLGGFSLEFPNNFNDLDFNFKAVSANLRIIWCPHATVRHLESSSRDPRVLPNEFERLRTRWGRYFGYDPFTPSDN